MPAPPNSKTVSADNVTGANITPVTTCTLIILSDTAISPSLDYTVTLGTGSIITRIAGREIVIRAARGTSFLATVTIGVLKANTAGTIVMAQEEY